MASPNTAIAARTRGAADREAGKGGGPQRGASSQPTADVAAWGDQLAGVLAAKIMDIVTPAVEAALAKVATSTQAAEAAAARAEAASTAAPPAHNHQGGMQVQLPSGKHADSLATQSGGVGTQVAVRMPASSDPAALRATASAAVVAAAECDPACIDGAHVLYRGKSTLAQGGQAAQRTRQAVVMVYVRHAPIVVAAVRHSSRLASMDEFKGVYITQALTPEQKATKAAYWRGSTELRVARSQREPIRWVDGVPHRRAQGAGGRAEWRALPLPQE
jgi:hypothetical protein